MLILLLAVGGRWLIGRGLAPLGQMASAARQITTQGDLAARMPDADDSTEVGRLGGAINTMLDRIQQAFGARLRSEQKVRQFAADASHELRTPLTTIRGYAELYRQGALGPDQLPDAMRRIEQEAQRMSTLVAELLELARLDRTSSLDLAETDLAGLVRDAAADARAVEPDRPVRAEAPDRLVAVVDEARIRQVLANLLGNIREHTRRARPSRSGSARRAMASCWKSLTRARACRRRTRRRPSTGSTGAPPPSGRAAGTRRDGQAAGHPAARTEDPEGDGTCGPDSGGGSGLGLSIVQAIAVAHGGQATLESWPGHGTRVRIWLPPDGPAWPTVADPVARFELLRSPPGQELLDHLGAQEVTPGRATRPDTALRLGTQLRRRYPADLVAAAMAQHELRPCGPREIQPGDADVLHPAGLGAVLLGGGGPPSRGPLRPVRAGWPTCAAGSAATCWPWPALGPGPRVLAVDRDPLHLRMAEANAEAYGVDGGVTAMVSDVRDADLAGVEAVFIDPARRTGRRRMPAGESEPPLRWCLDLAGQVAAVGIKAAPGIARDAVPAGWELEFVAVGRDLKEATAWSPALATAARRATHPAGRPHADPPAGSGRAGARARGVPSRSQPGRHPRRAGGGTGPDARRVEDR